MNEPVWVTLQTARAVHAIALTEHGGSPGLRDRGLLESAIARPQQIFHYETNPTLERLAAAYICGVIQNYAFVDGNKRTRFVLGAIFLARNGCQWHPPPAETANVILEVAAGILSEEMLVAWVQKWSGAGRV